MKATLTRVGPFGVQTDQTGDRWVSNGTKKFQVIKDLKVFQVGDEVELEYVENGQYLNMKSMVKLGTKQQSIAPNDKPAINRYKTDPEDSLRMSRAAAVTAVFRSPTFAAQLNDTDISQAISDLESETVRVTNYILYGKYSEVVETKHETTAAN